MEEASADLSTTGSSRNLAEVISSANAAASSSIMLQNIEHQVPAAIALLSTLSVIGCLGNGLVLSVYCRKLHDRQTATIFILVLAVSDSWTCGILIPYTIAVEYTEWRFPTVGICKLYYFMNNFAIFFSSLLISAIAVDRYLCICQPFLKILTVDRVKRLLITLAGCAFVMGTVATFQIHLVPIPGDNFTSGNVSDNNSFRYQCVEVQRMGNNSLAVQVFYHLVQKGQFFCFFLCIGLVVVLYVLIYLRVREMAQKRAKLLNRRPTQPRLSCIPITTATAGDTPDAGSALNTPSSEVQRRSLFWAPTHQQQQQKSGPIKSTLSLAQWPNRESRDSSCLTLTDYRLSISQNQQSLGTQRPSQCPNPIIRESSTGFQNMKIATMLFVVAVTYILTFLPATLMANQAIDVNLPIFYLYYVNNAANPIIYGFMNPTFRTDVLRCMFPEASQNDRMEISRRFSSPMPNLHNGSPKRSKHQRLSLMPN